MANRKVFDIIPPKGSKESIEPAKHQKGPSFFEKLGDSAKKVIPPSPPKIKFKVSIPRKIAWWPLISLVVLLLAAGAAYFLIEPKAELEIWPVKEQLELKIQVLVAAASQQSTGSILGEIVTSEQSFSEEFPSTGIKTKATKASGIIKVYNAYSTSPQALITATRFVSDDGKLFRTPKRVVIPGAHYEGSRLIPGEIDIVVEAGEPGDEYSIGPSTFSIPGLAGTARYTAFYAKSFESMTGGAKAETPEVTGEDLAAAEEILTSTALEECKTSLENSLSIDEYIVVKEAIEGEILEATPLAEEGQELSNFTFQVKAEAKALVFKKQDIENIAMDRILEQTPEGKQLDENSLAIGYVPQSVDLKKGKILLDLEISAEVYPTIDENSIKETIKNQRLDEIEASLRAFSEIDRFQIRLWPFWVNKAPTEVDGIDLKLRLD